MNDAVKLLFEMAYLPVAQTKNRYNGGDFLKVAVELLDDIRKNTNSTNEIKDAATTMVYCFNDLLNPKLTAQECDGMINLLVENNPMIRCATYFE